MPGALEDAVEPVLEEGAAMEVAVPAEDASETLEVPAVEVPAVEVPAVDEDAAAVALLDASTVDVAVPVLVEAAGVEEAVPTLLDVPDESGADVAPDCVPLLDAREDANCPLPLDTVSPPLELEPPSPPGWEEQDAASTTRTHAMDVRRMRISVQPRSKVVHAVQSPSGTVPTSAQAVSHATQPHSLPRPP